MCAWIIPVIAWAVRGTNLSVGEVLVTVGRPLGAGTVAGVLAFGVGLLCDHLVPLARLVIQTSALFVTYGLLLYFATGQKSLYLDVLRGFKFHGGGTNRV